MRRTDWVAMALGAAVLVVGSDHACAQMNNPTTKASLAEARQLDAEAFAYFKNRKFDAAILSSERALAIQEKILGPDHRNVAALLNNLAEIYRAKGDFAHAEALYQRALAIQEKALGPGHPHLATSLHNLAELYLSKGDYARAEPLYERALTIQENALGPEHHDVAASLNSLALLHKAKADYVRAEPLFLRALAIVEKSLGPDHPDVAASLYNLAGMYEAKGDSARAEPLCRRALAIEEKAFGADDPNVASSLLSLAGLYRGDGDYARAEPLYKRSLAILEKTLGPDHPDVGASLSGLAGLYEAKGDYAGAEPLSRRALTISEKALGPDHPHVATSLGNLAGLFLDRADYAHAEPLYRRALAIRERVFGPDHPEVASLLDPLAGLYTDKGDYARAEPLYQRALAIREKALGPDHPDVGGSLNNLARLHKENGNYALAEPLYRRALAIAEKSRGPAHRHVATALNNLAVLYQDNGDYARAEPLYQRALTILEKALGPHHHDVAATLNNLGRLHQLQGDYAGAEPIYQRALEIFENALGPDHPVVASVLNNLAGLYQARRDYVRAEPLYQRAVAIEEKNLVLLLDTDSEPQQRAYLNTFRVTASELVEHAVATGRPQAAQLALTTLFRRKGRALDATAGSLRLLRLHIGAGEQTMLDELLSLRSQRSTLILRGPGSSPPSQYRSYLADLQERDEKVEAAISARSAGFRAQQQPITIAAVQAAIPRGVGLVEWVIYRPSVPNARSEATRWGSPRYAAVVLPSQGEPRWVDLGEASLIDRAVEELRAALGRPDRRDVRALGRALEAMVMRPVRALVGDARQLLLSPDGALNLVPFAALVDETDHYLVEHYAFTYLTSGRDLLHASVHTTPPARALVMANPDYDDPGQSGPMPALSHLFQPLVGASLEARDVAQALPGATVLTGAQATEARLKQVHGPRVLHLATHGFFEQPPSCGSHAMDATSMNPLARSGLALAGANACHSGPDDDGLLTALEVSAMDLYGTKLVVLSACETGVGKVETGEGVYGLRRALVLAGAETQVMSLWRVDNTATREQMAAYYARLQQGGGRSEAMRQVQLAMLGSANRAHPYYWASFIVSGEQSSLDGRPVMPELLRVPPGHGGCSACTIGSAPEGGSVWAAVVLAGLAVARRRGRGRATPAP